MSRGMRGEEHEAFVTLHSTLPRMSTLPNAPLEDELERNLMRSFPTAPRRTPKTNNYTRPRPKTPNVRAPPPASPPPPSSPPPSSRLRGVLGGIVMPTSLASQSLYPLRAL